MSKLSLNPKNVFYLMCLLVVLTGAGAVASVLYGNTFLQKQSNKLVQLKLAYKIPEANQTALKIAKADIDKYEDLEAVAKTIVPQQKDQALAVRQISSIADSTLDPTTKQGIKILSITFPSSNLGQPTVVAPAVNSPTDNTGTKSTSAAPATPKVVTPPVSQVQPVQGISGVYVLPITIQSDPNAPVTFDQIIQFLTKLENNRRSSQVGQISITPQNNAAGKTGLSFTVTVNVYIKP